MIQEPPICHKKMDYINIRLLTDWSKCNYKCSYCIVAEQQDKFVSWSETNYKIIVKNLCKASFKFNIRLGVQGEFFANKTLIEGGRVLSNAESCVGVNLITNLSLNPTQFDRAFEGYNISKLGVVASYHPTEITDIEAWLETAHYMNDKVDFSVVVVAYPPILDNLEVMVARLHKMGIHVAVQSYIGKYMFRTYPEEYTKEEKQRIKAMTYSRHDYEFFVNLKKPGMCYAGSRSFFVNTVDGKVLTCGIPLMKDARVIGNLLENPSIDFLNDPMQCTSPRCLCDTENINTVVFHNNYKRIGVNQHKFRFKHSNCDASEWDIDY